MTTGALRIVCLMSVLMAAIPAAGRTWTVEKDGTGDFAVIQDAVDAASSGDVIEIGPGRYEEYQTVQGGSYWFDLHVVVPENSSLTFIGAGADATIIGSDDPYAHSNLTYGIGGTWNVHVTARDLGIENCSMYSIGISSGSVNVDGCRFFFENAYTEDTIGIDGGFTEGAVIRDCRFEGLYQGVATIESQGGVLIEDCEFIECTIGTYAWTSNSSDVRIVDSYFFECGLTGIEYLTAAGGEIVRCRLINSRILLSSCAEVSIVDSEVVRDDGGFALLLQNTLPVTLINNVFTSNGDVIQCRSYGQGTFRDNHILRTGAGYSIRCLPRATPYPDIDFSGNWWGTTDLEEIAEGIWDRHDDAGVAHNVIFEPVADGPVPVETRTLSEVKDLFR